MSTGRVLHVLEQHSVYQLERMHQVLVFQLEVAASLRLPRRGGVCGRGYATGR
jgi:hypothetical protein